MLSQRLPVRGVIACICFAALLICQSICLAQIGADTATINGTISDATGALVPDAKVTATNVGTGISISTQSNTDGSFIIPALSIGTYTLTAVKQGFATYKETGVELHTAIVTTVNPVLKVGSTASQVTVTASTTQVETSTAEHSATIGQEQAYMLPLDGRVPQSLEALVPGVVNLTPDTTIQQRHGQADVMSINGMGERGTLWYADGVYNMNSTQQSPSAVPNIDAIQEVQVLSNNYSVQYSLYGGSVVLVQTKSGTDTFHGTLFDYLRNKDLNARNFFSPTTAAQIQNIAGGTLGGPLFIPLPGHRPQHAKTFFFISEQMTLPYNASAITGATATAAERAGNFSALCTSGFNASGSCNTSTQQLMNPATHMPFLNNMITTPLNTNALAFMNVMAPLPNNVAGGFNNYLNTGVNPINAFDWQVKVDHTFSEKYRLLGELFDSTVHNNANYDGGGNSIFAVSTRHVLSQDILAQLQLTAVLKPSMVNTAAFSVTTLPGHTFLGGIWQTTQIPGFTQTLPYKPAQYPTELPQIDFGQGYTSMGIGNGSPQYHYGTQNKIVSDDWGWLRGNHYLQAGFNFDHIRGSQDAATGDSEGDWNFSGNFTGNAIADFLLGDSTTFTQASARPHPFSYYNVFSPYFQDRFKVTRRLTLTAGLRILWMPEPYDPKGVFSNFVPSMYNLSQAPTVNTNGTLAPGSYNPVNGIVLNGTNGVPLNATYGPNWYFAPSGGFAYDVFGNGKTSIRGGYGLAYQRSPINEDCTETCVTQPPLVQTTTLVNAPFPDPIGAASSMPTTQVLTATSPHFRAAQFQTYSLSLEHDFGHNWFGSIAGAGSIARHGLNTENINQPLPDSPYDFNPAINTGTYTYTAANLATYQGYDAINMYMANGNAIWNGLEVNARHPVGNNLLLSFAYTYSHALADEASANGPVTGSSPQNIYRQGSNYGNTPTYVPNVFTASWIWGLPYQNARGLLGLALGGWKYAGITDIQDGLPLTPGESATKHGLATRPNRLSGSSVAGARTVAAWFNTAAFAQPAAGYFGTAAPYSIPGPGVINFDMALYKAFHITERHTLDFRCEAFNIFNRANFNAVSTSQGAGNFGHITSAHEPRTIELSLHFQF